MATVYKGYQDDINRNVAIKVLPPHPGRNDQFVERFRMEARTIARLQHPHILPLYDYGTQSDIFYLVMALVDGGTLSDRIQKGPMSLADVEHFVRQIAPALDYAHRQSIIHRDIKPDNVLIDSENNALLSDFGIAKLLEEGTGLTVTGTMVGTPAYMSPEQAQGMSVTHRSDLYSLGIVVYEMITGTQPYKAQTPFQIVLKHMQSPVPSLLDVMSGLPEGIDPVLQKMLAKEPEDRFANATDFANAFSEAIHGHEAAVGQRLYRPSDLGDAGTETVHLNTASGFATGTGIGTGTNAGTPSPTQVATPTQINAIPQTGLGLLPLLAIMAIVAAVVAAAVVLAIRPPVTATGTPVAGLGATEAPTTVPIVPVNTSPPSFGVVSFANGTAAGDTANLQVQDLRPPGENRSYAAWLVDTANDETVLLGPLVVDGLGNGILTFTDDDGRNLPTEFNALLITREAELGDAPAEDVAYSGYIAPAVNDALREILVASEEGLEGGSLLDGLLREANVLKQHAGLAANATNVGGMHTHSEHSVNILRGTREDLNGDGSGQNPGAGVGTLSFLEKISQRLETAATAPGVTPSVQSQIEYIRVCVENTRQRTDEIITLEGEMLTAAEPADVAAQAAQSTELAEQMIDGFDLNDNGQVEPFEGECGITQIGTYGLLVGRIEVIEGGLPTEA